MSELEQELRAELQVAASHVDADAAPPDGFIADVQLARRARTRRTSTVLAGVVALLAVSAIGLMARPSPSDTSSLIAGPDGQDLVLTDPGPAHFEMSELPGGPLSPREDMTGVWTGDELIIWGGRSNGTNASDGAAYDPVTRTWRTIAPSPLSARNRHSAVWTGTEMIVWGGTTQGGGVGGLRDGAAYDPATDTWRSIADAPAGTDRTTAIGVWADDRAVFAGGGNSTGYNLESLLSYDVATDSWSQLSAPGPVVAATSVDGRLAVATVDPSSFRPDTLRVSLVDATTGDAEPLPTLELPYEAGNATSVGLSSQDGMLVLAVTAPGERDGDERTTVGVLPVGADGWQAVTTVSGQDFAPGSQVQMVGPPGITAWGGPWLIGDSWEPRAIAVGTTRTVEAPTDVLAEAPCGSSGVAVWTGTDVLQWGGQNCRREGSLPQVDDGISYRVVLDD